MTFVEPAAVPSVRSRGGAVAVVGMLLIASTYGMARFGVGLFAPQLTQERPELASAVGVAAAAQFVSYAAAAGAAFLLADRRPRVVLALAGATAALGCLGVGLARNPVLFVAAVFVGGMGAGFASPAMVRVVDSLVVERRRPTAQSLVNAGTAVGVVATGLLAFGVTTVLPAWSVMAAICAACAAAVLLLVRRSGSALRSTPSAGRAHVGVGDWRDLVGPARPALLVGAGSALVWTFGPTLLVGAEVVAADQVGWLWIVLGAGGLAGPLTGRLVGRLGLRRAWACLAVVLAAADLAVVVAVGTGSVAAAFAAMALFGAGYMCLTGVLILWATDVWPAAAGAATSVLFMLLAVGQAVGSIGFDLSGRSVGPTSLALAAAVLCLVGAGAPRTRSGRAGVGPA